MTFSLPLLILSTFLLIFFAGCVTKKQSLACFKGSPVCYTQQNFNSSEATKTIIYDTKETDCENCFAVVL